MENNFNWKRAVIWSSISFSFIILLIFNPVKDAGYAGERFAYNLTFFFPILILITITSIAGIIFTTKYLRKEFRNDNKYKLVKLLTPFILLLPATIQILFFVVSMVMTFYLIGHPKDYEPEFTSRKIVFDNDSNTIYIHGSLYGKYQMKRTLYISNDSVPVFSPDTFKNFFYQGENELELFYSQKRDTLLLFLPKGFAVRHPVDFKNEIFVKQIEYDEDSISRLRNLYNSGKMNAFYWLTNEQQKK
jgi:hypothetical protein